MRGDDYEARMWLNVALICWLCATLHQYSAASSLDTPDSETRGGAEEAGALFKTLTTLKALYS